MLKVIQTSDWIYNFRCAQLVFFFKKGKLHPFVIQLKDTIGAFLIFLFIYNPLSPCSNIGGLHASESADSHTAPFNLILKCGSFVTTTIKYLVLLAAISIHRHQLNTALSHPLFVRTSLENWFQWPGKFCCCRGSSRNKLPSAFRALRINSVWSQYFCISAHLVVVALDAIARVKEQWPTNAQRHLNHTVNL